MIAYVNDGISNQSSLCGNSRDNDAQILSNMFQTLSFILPCRACQTSYASFLKESVAELSHANGNLADLCMQRKLFEVVYSLHSKVNAKLARTSGSFLFQKLNISMREDQFLDLFVENAMKQQIPLHIAEKRFAVFNRETINVDSTWILLLALAQRVKSKQELDAMRLLVSVSSLACRKSSSMHVRRFAEELDSGCSKFKTSETFDSVYTTLMDRYMSSACGTDCKVDKRSIENRLLRMQSSMCSPTSCT